MRNVVRITVIVENTASGSGLRAEDGLAYWIEAGVACFAIPAGRRTFLWSLSFHPSSSGADDLS